MVRMVRQCFWYSDVLSSSSERAGEKKRLSYWFSACQCNKILYRMKIIGYIKSYGLCKEADWEVLRWSAIENT